MKKSLFLLALIVLVVGLFGCESLIPAANVMPTASFSFAAHDLVVNLDGSGSIDIDGSVVLWEWDFGDGSSAFGATPQHTYVSGGTYTITLVVTDNEGGLDQVSRTVVLSAPAPPPEPVGVPVALFTHIQSGQYVTFDGSASYDVHVDGYTDGYIAWASWEFGDGTHWAGYWTWFDGTPMAMYAEHTYIKQEEEAWYTLTLTVKDNEGNTDSATCLIYIEAI